MNASLSLDLQGAEFEGFVGTNNADTVTGNALNNGLAGAGGDDTYILVADNAGESDTIEENNGGGTDTIDFSGTTTTGITLDLDGVGPQVGQDRVCA